MKIADHDAVFGSANHGYEDDLHPTSYATQSPVSRRALLATGTLAIATAAGSQTMSDLFRYAAPADDHERGTQGFTASGSTISAASVDETGYYLSVTHGRPASASGPNRFWPFLDYDLASEIGRTPRVRVEYLRMGFERSAGAGIAVPTPRPKFQVGYKMIRRPTSYDPTTGA